MNDAVPKPGPWLAVPDVQMPGTAGKRHTLVTDGLTTRIKEKPQFNAPAHEGRSWPAAPVNSPWLQRLNVNLGPGQVLITDGLNSWVKDKPVPSFGGTRPDEAVEFTVTTTAPPTTTSTTTTSTTSSSTTTSTAPPTTSTSTSQPTTTTFPPVTTTGMPPMTTTPPP